MDESVLSSSQRKDRTSDRILDSLEKVAGSVADTDSQSLDTKNIRIKAARASLVRNVTWVDFCYFTGSLVPLSTQFYSVLFDFFYSFFTHIYYSALTFAHYYSLLFYSLSSDNGVEFTLPAATVSSNQSAYIITYSTTKVTETPSQVVISLHQS